MESVVKVLDLVKMGNVVVNMVGVEKQISIVISKKVVNLNLENVIQQLLKQQLKLLMKHLLENVVKVLDLAKMGNVVVNMVGVEKQISIVISKKVVNLNLENVIQQLLKQQLKLLMKHLLENVVKVLDLAKMGNVVVNMVGVEKQISIVISKKVVSLNLENVIQQLLRLQLKLLKKHLLENVVKDIVHVRMVNAVLNMDGVERQMPIVK